MLITAVKAVSDWRLHRRGKKNDVAYRRSSSLRSAVPPAMAVAADDMARNDGNATLSDNSVSAVLRAEQALQDVLDLDTPLPQPISEDDNEHPQSPNRDPFIDADWWPTDMAAQQELGVLPLGWLGDDTPDRSYSYAARAYLSTTGLEHSKVILRAIRRAFTRKSPPA